MRGSHVSSVLPLLVLLWLGVAAAQKASSWKTLSGNAPSIIAKGGFSGLFPDSSEFAYDFALIGSSVHTVLYCDIRLTRDGIGICLPHLNMENGTNVAAVYPQDTKNHLVNGIPVCGWFPVDYKFAELGKVSLKQSFSYRSSRFDGVFPILSVEELLDRFEPSGFWLNVQHDGFYGQFNLNMKNYVLNVSKHPGINYISSPEVRFLNGIHRRVRRKTRLVFRFLDKNAIEPSTNQSYGSILANLTFLKTFASGILVPKEYIWPVSPDNYLDPCTSLVNDAHDAGLEIYAAGFANDFQLSYNYSFDPLAECLSFISSFSVDGLLTDFPITASEAIGCFTDLKKSNTDHGKPLIISRNGASGDYPGCSDLAYQKAVEDGADVIDCPVEVTKDGIPICMSFVNIKENPGFFTFTWNDIITNLRPKMSQPFGPSSLERNPRYQSAGNFTRLSDFLDFAKDKALYGIMIIIDAFSSDDLVAKADAVLQALEDAGYNNQTSKKVMIRSESSALLMKLKQETNYELVYKTGSRVSDVEPAAVAELKKFATALIVLDSSVIASARVDPEERSFTTNRTALVQSVQSAGLAVYVEGVSNELASRPYDFFSDATAELNEHVMGAGVDGIITDFPATARRYKANSCRDMGNNRPRYMFPAEPGGLLKCMSGAMQPYILFRVRTRP